MTASGSARRIGLASPAATDRLAASLAAQARRGDVIALSGDLGAGKTAFARAFIRHLAGPDEEVPSPTFTLAQVYEARAGSPPLEIWHVDLYRLAGPDEASELGLEEAFGRAVCLIEWPDRLGGLLPAGALEIELAFCDNPDARLAKLRVPEGWRARIDGLTGCLEGAGGEQGSA